MRTLAALAAVLLVGGIAGAAGVQVLATSGTTVDGIGIARLARPQGSVGAPVFFLGTSTTLRVPDGSGGFTTLLKTGDALPAPLHGTVNEITQAVVAGDLVGIRADTNGPDAADAILLVEGGALRPAVVISPSDPSAILTFAMNARGDLVYHTRNQSAGEVYVRPQGSAAIKVGNASGKTSRRIPEPVIDEAGNAAWADSGALYHWDPAHGTRPVATGLPPVVVKRGVSALAINATGGVAFVSRDEAALWSPDSGVTTVLVRRRDHVGKSRILRFTSVGFLGDGSVVIGVRATRSSARYLRANAGVLSPDTGSGSTFTSGAPLRPEQPTGIFQTNGTTMSAVVRSGDEIPGVGVIAELLSYVARGSTIAFLADVAGVGSVLARWRDGTIQPLLADGDPAVGGGVVLLGPLDLRARATAVGGTEGNASLLVVRTNKPLRSIRAPRGKRFRPFELADVRFAGNRLFVFGRTGDDEQGGLFVALRHRLVAALVHGHVLPGTDARLASVELVASDGPRVVFAATDAAGRVALYHLQAGVLTRIGALPQVPSMLDAGAGHDVVLVDGSDAEQLATVSGNVLEPVVSTHDPTRIGNIDDIDDFTVLDDRVVLSARLAGDGVRRALLAVALP